MCTPGFVADVLKFVGEIPISFTFFFLELFRDSSHSIPLVLIVLNFTWYSPALWVILTSHCPRPPRPAKETPPQADVRLLRQVKDEEVHQINKDGEFSKSESHYKLFFGTCNLYTFFWGKGACNVLRIVPTCGLITGIRSWNTDHTIDDHSRNLSRFRSRASNMNYDAASESRFVDDLRMKDGAFPVCTLLDGQKVIWLLSAHHFD